MLKRGGAPVVWGTNMGPHGGPLTWRPVAISEDMPEFIKGDLAYCTCGSGHECRLTRKYHSVAADGTVSPSYVCPIEGCGFHVFVRLEGWKNG